jgi:hypothetical protein
MSVHVHNVLILEDDLETLENILRILREIEYEKRISFSATILPDYQKTETYINKNPHIKFDILLLDRDCFLGGSFHVVDLNNFDLDKVISISSLPQYNQVAEEKGIKKTIWKDYSNLSEFANKLKEEIITLLQAE